MTEPMPNDTWQSEFPQDDDIVYLNHAAVSPWPRRTADAVKAFAEENLRRGARDYPQWLAVEQRLRERLMRLTGAASTNEVALVKNTSEALSIVAHGIDWQAGESVVGINPEFPSNKVVWESLERYGVAFHGIDVNAQEDPELGLIAACELHKPRLLAVSSVHFATGLRLDLERLGNYCRESGTLFCVDAIQSLGVLPMHVRRYHIDFLAADGHKWMMGPEGLGVFYVRQEHIDALRLYQYGWHMVAAIGDYDRPDWSPSPTATRFECGSPNMLAVHALDASLSLIEQVGIDTITTNVIKNINYLIENIKESAVISRTNTRRQSGIFTCRVHGREQQPVYQSLMRNGVVCAHRGGGIRFSPHFYTTPAQLDRALAILSGLV